MEKPEDNVAEVLSQLEQIHSYDYPGTQYKPNEDPSLELHLDGCRAGSRAACVSPKKVFALVCGAAAITVGIIGSIGDQYLHIFEMSCKRAPVPMFAHGSLPQLPPVRPQTNGDYYETEAAVYTPVDGLYASRSVGTTTGGSAPTLRCEINPTVGPQGVDATVITALDTSGTLKVAHFSFLEYYLATVAFGMRFLLVYSGVYLVLNRLMIGASEVRIGRRLIVLPFGLTAKFAAPMLICLGLAAPVAFNSLVSCLGLNLPI